MTFHDYKYKGMVVMDGHRLVAKARPVRIRGWIVVGYGLSWIDAKDTTNTFGIFDPQRLFVHKKDDARKLLKSLL